MRRSLALGLLILSVLAVGMLGLSWIDSYADAQSEIAARREDLRGLRELAEARIAFGRLLPKAGKPALILAADADAQEVVATAMTHAAEGQQVIVDGVETVGADTALATAAVRLRGTQSGLYAFLRAVEEQTPYLLVPRLEITPYRAADPEHGKPLVLSADLRVAVLVAPTATPKPTAAPPSAEPSP